jgi:hypothetical protein
MSLTAQIVNQAIPVIMALTGLFFAWLANEIRGKVRNERVAQWLENATDLAHTVVNEMEQTTAAQLKEASADGKLDTGDARDVRDIALTSLKSHLGQKGIKEALKIFGFEDETQLTKLLVSKIESAVAGNKTLAPIAAIGETLEPATLKPPTY